ncbi:M23 family metallopeptidase [uncultured Porphyromonas sp.]|uniref:M23 family metallopeptidase n=1 Tax=uncultured Porphyromonas sp. TaxID=159274 RepID=UPI0026343B26|nr:M23 family metallopeptidase [uncultured Porphyromonas sp.]
MTSRDSLATQNLLADGYTIETAKDAKARISSAEMERALEREALEYPAIDLYGEDSWTDWVNPFAGKSSPRVPATYNIDCSGFVMPLKGNLRITSNYGYRARYRRQHKGIDIALRTGDDVRAAFDGKVRIRGYERGGYGNYIVIRHPNGLETVYGHMSRCIAKEGQIVRAGEVIGKGGSTGRSTGPHLHFETRFLGIDINPARIIDFGVGAPQSDYYTFVAPKGYKTYDYEEGDTQSKAGDAKYKAKAQKSHAKVSHTPRIYRVKKGDTLSHIAKKTGTSVSHLCKANNMSSRATLRPGQALKY